MDFPQMINAYDAYNRKFIGGYLQKKGEKVVFEKKSEKPYETSLYISPGFLDMHVHVFEGYGIYGMDANLFGHRWGVHCMADCGTCGTDNLQLFKNCILPKYKDVTKLKLWLNICRFGLPSNHETIDFTMLEPGPTAQCAIENSDMVIGIKVRMNNDVPERDCLVPLFRALEAAELANMPLMVHISAGPPYAKDILPHLRKGDVVTHIFNGKTGSPFNDDGSPIKELLEAQERGVLFDVAHGYSSFNLETCRKAIEQNFMDVTISTDKHKKCSLGAPFTFVDVMSKVHGCGMPLEKVLYGVTKKASDIMKFENWCTFENMEQNATIFSYVDNSDKTEFVDPFGNMIIPEKKFIANAVITNGLWKDIEEC